LVSVLLHAWETAVLNRIESLHIIFVRGLFGKEENRRLGFNTVGVEMLLNVRRIYVLAIYSGIEMGAL